ncbi:secretion protein [Burkholderia cepacia]|uniref:secretion protein n=1 Tax=Burkholderia cepacia TaxID=292 RepID=UPI00158B91DC|nr:secretion protein [Burkholderia cepacia]
MLQLTPGQHQLHGGADADIRLIDWTDTGVVLEVAPSGVVRAMFASASAGEPEENSVATDQETAILADFVPIRFGDTVLCVGPDDTPWPSDLDLLSTLLMRSPDILANSYRRKRRYWYCVLAACIVISIVSGTAMLLTTAPNSEAALRHGADYQTMQIQEALSAVHMTELQVRTVGNTSVVTGMVANLSDDQLVRSTLAKIASKGIVRGYDVAQNVVLMIEDSLSIVGVRVKYLGNGEFVITGTVDSNDALDKAVTRLRADLDSNIRRLIVQTDEHHGQPVPAAGQYSEIVSSSTVQYMQTPDGIKHIYVSVTHGESTPSIDVSTDARGTEKTSVAARAGLPDF